MNVTEMVEAALKHLLDAPRDLLGDAYATVRSGRKYWYALTVLSFIAFINWTGHTLQRYQALIAAQRQEAQRLLAQPREPLHGGREGGLAAIVLAQGGNERREPNEAVRGLLRDLVDEGRELAADENYEVLALEPCGPEELGHVRLDANEWSWGPMYCEKDKRVGQGHLASGAASVNVVANRPTLYNLDADLASLPSLRDERRALLPAYALFDDSLQERMRLLSQPWQSQRVVQVYYAGLGGVVGEWDPKDRGTEDIRQRPLKSLVDANYTLQVREKPAAETPESTRPYLDVGGHGFVWTHCRAVTTEQHQGKTLMGQRLGSLFLGVMCVDIAVPLESILGRGDRELKQPNGPGRWTHYRGVLYEYWRTNSAGLLWLRTNGSSLVGADWGEALGPLASWLEDRYQPEIGSTAFHNTVLPREDTRDIDDAWFLVPLGGDQTNHAQWLYVYQRKSDLIRLVDVLPPLALLILTLWSFVAGTVAAQVTSEESAKVTVLRNLQVPTVFIDQDERILAANDRAEEVLGRPLPRGELGRIPDPDPGPYACLSEMLSKRRWILKGGQSEWVALDSLRKRSEASRVTRYYAYLMDLEGRRTGTILMVQTSVYDRGTDGAFRAFGVLQVVRDRLNPPKE